MKQKETSKNTTAQKVGRGIAKGLGAVPDFLALPVTLASGESLSLRDLGVPLQSSTFSDNAAEIYDALFRTSAPETLGDRSIETIAEFLTGGGFFNAAGKAGGKAAQFLRTQGPIGYAGLGAAGLGTELAREALPDSSIAPVIGGLAAGVIPGAVQSTVKALQPNKEGIEELSKLIGEQFRGKGQHAETAINRLTDTALEQRNPITQAYQSAFDASKETPLGTINNLKENILNKLSDKNIYPNEINRINAWLNDFDHMAKKDNISFGQLENRREILNGYIFDFEKEGKTAKELRATKAAFDQSIDEIIENSLDNSDKPEFQKILKEFKKARQLNAEWEAKYSAKSGKEFGKKFVEEMVERARFNDEPFTPESIVNRIYGTSQMGFNEKSPYIVNELKNHLTPNEMHEVKVEALARLFKPINTASPTPEQFKSFVKNWDTFQSENNSLLKSLLNKEERKQVNTFAKKYENISKPSVLREKIQEIHTAGPLVLNVWDAIGNVVEKTSITPQALNQIARPTLTEQKQDSQLLELNSLNSEELRTIAGLPPKVNEVEQRNPAMSNIDNLTISDLEKMSSEELRRIAGLL